MVPQIDREGLILFNPAWGGPLYQVNAEGGDVTLVSVIVEDAAPITVLQNWNPEGR
jgi:hypothetical protein